MNCAILIDTLVLALKQRNAYAKYWNRSRKYQTIQKGHAKGKVPKVVPRFKLAQIGSEYPRKQLFWDVYFLGTAL